MFDTLSYSEDLAGTGIPEGQAKLQAKALSKVLESDDLAKRSDVAELRADVKTDIIEFKADVKVDIADLRADITVVKADITGIKADVATLKTEMVTKADMRAQMSEMELRIIKWQIGGVGLVITAIITAIKFLK